MMIVNTVTTMIHARTEMTLLLVSHTILVMTLAALVFALLGGAQHFEGFAQHVGRGPPPGPGPRPRRRRVRVERMRRRRGRYDSSSDDVDSDDSHYPYGGMIADQAEPQAGMDVPVLPVLPDIDVQSIGADSDIDELDLFGDDVAVVAPVVADLAPLRCWDGFHIFTFTGTNQFVVIRRCRICNLTRKSWFDGRVEIS